MWDERDEELGLRERLAKLIASKLSGINPDEVHAAENDYVIADFIDNKIDEWIEKDIL